MVVILTIDIGESAEKVAHILARNGISLPVLLDTEGKVDGAVPGELHPAHLLHRQRGLNSGHSKAGALQSAEELEDILNQLSSL